MLRKLTRMATIGSTVAALAFGAFALAAPPNRAEKRVLVDCKPGWRGSAVGAYGGVSFGVSCNNGRGQTTITGTVGTAYSVRMGVESDSAAFDCFFTGDAATVNETCAEVRLSIR